MEGKVRTVLGDIDPDEVGFTYPHEHLYCVPPQNQPDRDFELSSYDKSLYELNEFEYPRLHMVEGVLPGNVW